jgi:hypothetical protein
MLKRLAAILTLCFLAGCGGDEAKPTVITPVDGIKQNIDIGQSLKKDVKDAAKTNAATEEQLNKKKN